MEIVALWARKCIYLWTHTPTDDIIQEPLKRLAAPQLSAEKLNARVSEMRQTKRPKKPTKSKPLTGPKGGETTVTSGGLMRVVIYLAPEERKALRLISAYTERSVSEMVREKVQELIRETKKARTLPPRALG